VRPGSRNRVRPLIRRGTPVAEPRAEPVRELAAIPMAPLAWLQQRMVVDLPRLHRRVGTWAFVLRDLTMEAHRAPPPTDGRAVHSREKSPALAGLFRPSGPRFELGTSSPPERFRRWVRSAAEWRLVADFPCKSAPRRASPPLRSTNSVSHVWPTIGQLWSSTVISRARAASWRAERLGRFPRHGPERICETSGRFAIGGSATSSTIYSNVVPE